ncbi:MAG: TlpA family protein disulfide reductase [Spirochaetaceae bacterium]|nr:TlpA family protein disulfide reductase [Spirochaetaceae bacterium]
MTMQRRADRSTGSRPVATALATSVLLLFLPDAPAGAQAVGEIAPACTLQSIPGREGVAHGSPVLPPVSAGPPSGVERRFEGEVWLVDFWASWCPSCEAAFAFLDELERDLGPRGLRVLAVNLDADPDAARDFLAEHRIDFEVSRDPSGQCPRAFGVSGMPWSVLIDREGRVTSIQRGFRPREARDLRERIETMLESEAVLAPEPRS